MPSPTGSFLKIGSTLFALMEANWKVVYREEGKDVGLARVELYDRRTGRAETKDVAGVHPSEVERMMAALGNWVDAQKQIRVVLGKGARSNLDQQTLDQLRSLGYIGGKQ
jgi:predicted urease superfamily metal-dependent hydrolase